MLWKLQTILWVFLPADRDVNFTTYIFVGVLLLCGVAGLVGCFFKRKKLLGAACGISVSVLLCWSGLYLARPVWLRVATQDAVPVPAMDALQWVLRAPGFETAETDLRVGEQVVDHLVLVRLDADTDSDGLLNDKGAGQLDVIRVLQDDGSVYEARIMYDMSFDMLVQAMADFGAPPASVSDAIQSSDLNNAYENAWTLAAT